MTDNTAAGSAAYADQGIVGGLQAAARSFGAPVAGGAHTTLLGASAAVLHGRV